MREYGRVHSAFWSSRDVQPLSDDGRLLALYLLTCTHGTIAGAFRLPDGYVAEDIGWPLERVSEGFDKLFANGFARRCEATKWVWVTKFLQWNPPENPNQWKAIWKVAGQIPTQCTWRVDFLRVLAALSGNEPPPEANPCETLSEPFRNLNSISTATASQQEKEPTKHAVRALRPDPPEFLRFKATYPHRAGSQPWPRALQAITARLREGHSWNEILDGTSRYAEFCLATGKVGTEHVQQATRFCGPGKEFLQPWSLPSTKADVRLAGNLSAADEFMRRTEVHP